MSLATPLRVAAVTARVRVAAVSVRAPMAAAACAGFPLAGSGYVICYTRATDDAGPAGVNALFWAATGLALLTAGAVFALSVRKRAAALALTLVLGVLLSLPKFLRARGTSRSTTNWPTGGPPTICSAVAGCSPRTPSTRSSATIPACIC